MVRQHVEMRQWQKTVISKNREVRHIVFIVKVQIPRKDKASNCKFGRKEACKLSWEKVLCKRQLKF